MSSRICQRHVAYTLKTSKRTNLVCGRYSAARVADDVSESIRGEYSEALVQTGQKQPSSCHRQATFRLLPIQVGCSVEAPRLQKISQCFCKCAGSILVNRGDDTLHW